jgi:SAM-dependent methyltransferase
MDKKDYFTNQSKAYAAFRPTYPVELYDFIFKHLQTKIRAWDCATGNGQVAQSLAKHFQEVYATDISEQQIGNAIRLSNIFYSVASAEKTSFEDQQFDLITVGQALHWFNLPAFYKEVRRTLKRDGLLAVWGYAMLSVNNVIDPIFLDFYHNKVGPYWDEARKLVENHYREIDFPFDCIPCPDFFIKVNWTAEQFTGYLSSWSATQKFIKAQGEDPVETFRKELDKLWPSGEAKLVTFPVFMKMGRTVR